MTRTVIRNSPSGYEAVAAVVAGPRQHQHAGMRRHGILLRHSTRHRQPRQLHQLIDGAARPPPLTHARLRWAQAPSVGVYCGRSAAWQTPKRTKPPSTALRCAVRTQLLAIGRCWSSGARLGPVCVPISRGTRRLRKTSWTPPSGHAFAAPTSVGSQSAQRSANPAPKTKCAHQLHIHRYRLLLVEVRPLRSHGTGAGSARAVGSPQSTAGQLPPAARRHSCLTQCPQLKQCCVSLVGRHDARLVRVL